MKNTMKKIHISVLVALFGAAGTLSAAEFTLFAKGVDPANSSTYYNIDQGWNPTCWAASGSNVLAHWQDHHAGTPSKIAPTGTQVYDTFLRVYERQSSGQSDRLYRWWLGHYSAMSMGGWYPQENWEMLGGYYADRYAESEVDQMAWRYNTHNLGDLNYTTDISRAVYYALNQGYAMTITIPYDRHALTVYGASFDPETELITSLWLCDSSGASFEDAFDKMLRVRVSPRGENLCLLGPYREGIFYEKYDTKKYLGDVAFLGNMRSDTLAFISSGIAIPEPSAFGLLSGLGALALVVSRRRRK